MRQSTETSDRLLSRAEVEEEFGVSKRFLERAAANGDGPPRIYLGRSVRYRRSDLRAWIESNILDGGSR